jgi:hypothetical protein
MSQTTRSGTAVTVTVMPGTDTDELSGRHADGSIHSHVGNETTCISFVDGLVEIRGEGSGRKRFASAAMAAGVRSGMKTPPLKVGVPAAS